MADYLAGLKWDLCVLELSVNMAGTGFSGVVDAASAAAFALYGTDTGEQVGLLLDATRAP